MTTEHLYTPNSWQSVTTEVKKALDIKELSKSQAERMMKMYVLGKSLEEIITEMKMEKMNGKFCSG